MVAKEARTGRWKELTWAMSEEDVVKWSVANGCCKIARINGSREERWPTQSSPVSPG
jgi:hypothetical protein